MSHYDEKREYRQRKKELKKAGNKARRQFLKRNLAEHPDEAQWDEFEFGEYSTKDMNGKFRDPKRYKDEEEDDNYPDEQQDRY